MQRHSFRTGSKIRLTVRDSIQFQNFTAGVHRIDDMAGCGETASDIRTFQDALRRFPPRADKSGVASEVKDVFCGDCEAVFSSTYDLS